METKDIPVDNKSDDNKKEDITVDTVDSKEMEQNQGDETEVKIEVLVTKESEKENLEKKEVEQEVKEEQKVKEEQEVREEQKVKEEQEEKEIKEEQEVKEEPKKENQKIHNNQNKKEINDASTGEEMQNHKAVFILSYLGILFFLPLIVCPNSKPGRFHANQGLVLFLAAIGGEIVQIILEMILPLSFLGFLSFIFSIYGLAIFVLMVIGMINASKGEQNPLPVIGEIQIIK